MHMLQLPAGLGIQPLFHGIDLPPAQTKWINFTYIGCGVVAGLGLCARQSLRSRKVQTRVPLEHHKR